MSMTLKPLPPEHSDERTLLPMGHWGPANCPLEVTQDIADSESCEFRDAEAEGEGRLSI